MSRQFQINPRTISSSFLEPLPSHLQDLAHGLKIKYAKASKVNRSLYLLPSNQTAASISLLPALPKESFSEFVNQFDKPLWDIDSD